MMRRFQLTGFLFIIIFLFLPCLSFTAKAEQDSETVMRVAYSDNSSYIMQNSDGSFYGYGVDYLAELARYTNWKYEYISCSFEKSLEMLADGEIDFVCCLQRTENQEEEFLFSKYASGFEYASLYVNPSNTSIEYEDYDSFNGMQIGFISHFESNHAFDLYAKEHNFTYTPYYYETAAEMNAAFFRNEIDAITQNSFHINSNYKLVARYSLEPVYFALNINSQDLLAELNQAQLYLKLEDPYFENNLQNRYYSNTESDSAFFSMEEQFYIRFAPEITVAYHKDLYPFTYLQDGNMEGIAAEFFNKISDISGLRFRFIPYDSYPACLQALIDGEVDTVANVETDTFLGTDFHISTPYFDSPLATIVSPAFATYEEGAVRVAVHNIKPLAEQYLINTFPDYTLVECDSPTACVDAVLDGDVDMALINSYLINELLHKKSYEHIQVNNLLGYSTQIRIGISKHAKPLLIPILNKSIQSISSTERMQLVAHALSHQSETVSLLAFLTRYPFELSTVILFISILMLLNNRFKKHKQQKALEQIAYYDELTGLRKQKKFCMDMKHLLSGVDSLSYAVVYFDIDRFHYLNTVLSRKQSNELLTLLARFITDSLEDGEINAIIRNYDFVVLYHYKSNTHLLERLETIKHRFYAELKKSNIYYKIIVHTGIYLLYRNDESPEEIIYRAALANNSCHSGNDIAFFDDRLKDQVGTELQIESTMEEALKNFEFQPFFQPQYDITGTTIVGAEVLVRWRKADGTTIYPDDFIPVFEKNGFIIPLDYHMYEQVLKWMHKQRLEGRPIVRISVNLSRLHADDAYLQEHLTELADKYDIPHEWIEFELTESAFSEENENLYMQLKALRDKGFFISIDDFGAGYSSLNLLRHVPADILKIDKEFLKESDDSARSSCIIRDILIMAKDIHMEVICEGVETKEQLTFLQEIQCDYIQGYYFAKPMSQQDFEALLTSASTANVNPTSY